MANYSSLEAAIGAGTTNMTANRNNSANDDNTDTVPTGMAWFCFDGIQVTNLYVSGNSWIGFGASSEQLKVNRRDAKVYYEYTEAGTIGNTRFFKLRWCGYSAYSQTADAYAQQFDVFLFDNGQIYLNWFKVPTSSLDGINALVCGSATTNFTPTSGTAGEWTFTPSDAVAGRGWSVASGRPNIIVNHKSSGTAVLSTDAVQAITEYSSSKITWLQETPDGTSVTVSAACTATEPAESDYAVCTNGGTIVCLADGEDLSGKRLYVRAALSTTDATQTPTISGIKITVEDKKYKSFVPEKREGVYKVYCDISSQMKGINVSNKKSTRLHFFDGSTVPPFSTWFAVAGMENTLDAGYFYETEALSYTTVSASESSAITLPLPIIAGGYADSAALSAPPVLTAAETVNIEVK